MNVTHLSPALPHVLLISAASNLLALSHPLFMMHLYDKFLHTGHTETLIALSCMLAVCTITQMIIDALRNAMLLRVGENFHDKNIKRFFELSVKLPIDVSHKGKGDILVRDIDNVRSYFGSAAITPLFDMLFFPLYIIVCFLIHPLIGIVSVAGASFIMILALTGYKLSSRREKLSNSVSEQRKSLLDSAISSSESVMSMGLLRPIYENWRKLDASFLRSQRKVGNLTHAFSAVSKHSRLALQSAILATGAILVVRQDLSGGAMLASSIITSKALAPVDALVAGWKALMAATQSWARLSRFDAQFPNEPARFELPRPSEKLDCRFVSVTPPGARRPSLLGVNVAVAAGSALAVVGASGSGKTTFIRAMVGLWPLSQGKIELDDADLGQWGSAELGTHIGYLPQSVELLGGTVGENIARFTVNPDPDAVIAAAKLAGVHDLILQMEKGYDTVIGHGGGSLSGGQRQRIGLARALYGKPFLIALDEPNAHLDVAGEQALRSAIQALKADGRIVVIVSHKTAILDVCEQTLLLENGRGTVTGPVAKPISSMKTAFSTSYRA